MQLRIERQPEASGLIAGILFVEEVAYAQTVETKAGNGSSGSAIPTGDYSLRLLNRGGRELLALHRVPNGPDGGDRVVSAQVVDGVAYESKGDFRVGVVLRDGAEADSNGDIVLGPLGATPPFDVDASRDTYDGLLRQLRDLLCSPAGAWVTVIVPGEAQTVAVTSIDLSTPACGVDTKGSGLA